MTHATLTPTLRDATARTAAGDITEIGRYVTLYGVVLVFGWIGAMKFTAYEAGAIEGLIASSPLLSWLYAVFDQRGAANVIGVVEITAAALLALRPWSALAGTVGAIIVAVTTVVTLTFPFTAPGWESSLGGFPALSVVPGQFLIKNTVLLGAALWVLGDTLRELGATRRPI
jgi:uncharacterized membrane protein YkgB